MSSPFLIGDRICLSPLTMSDVTPKYIAWLNDHEVCRDNSHAIFPNTEARTRVYVEGVQQADDRFVFAIRWNQSGEHIGNVALQAVDWVHRSGELAILIGDREAWGKGVGLEAYQLLLGFGFNTLNLHRIYSRQTSRNVAMNRICEKCGMSLEGILRQALFKNGEYLDIKAYAILRMEYHA